MRIRLFLLAVLHELVISFLAITHHQAEWDEQNINDYGDYVVDAVPDQIIWLDAFLNAVERMNFFEGRATEYSKASTQGTWTEAFS